LRRTKKASVAEDTRAKPVRFLLEAKSDAFQRLPGTGKICTETVAAVPATPRSVGSKDTTP